MMVPNKVIIFAWQACRDGLPCYKNIKSKHVMVDNQCVFCEGPNEDLSHAFFFLVRGKDMIE